MGPDVLKFLSGASDVCPNVLVKLSEVVSQLRFGIVALSSISIRFHQIQKSALVGSCLWPAFDLQISV